VVRGLSATESFEDFGASAIAENAFRVFSQGTIIASSSGVDGLELRGNDGWLWF
jgi:hypothetical protein